MQSKSAESLILIHLNREWTQRDANFKNRAKTTQRIRVTSCLKSSRELERRRHLFHFGVVVSLRLFRGVLDGGEHSVGDGLRVFLQELGIECEGEEFSRAVDLDLHGAAAAGDFDFLGFELRLERLDTTLHFLGLFKKCAYAGHSGKWLRLRLRVRMNKNDAVEFPGLKVESNDEEKELAAKRRKRAQKKMRDDLRSQDFFASFCASSRPTRIKSETASRRNLRGNLESAVPSRRPLVSYLG